MGGAGPPHHHEPGAAMTTYAEPDAPARRGGYYEPPGRQRDPLWAKLCLIIGSLVMVASGIAVVAPKVLANWATKDIPREKLIPNQVQGENIDGAINLLLLGMDERSGNSTDLIRADTIIIVHIPKNHSQVYMISLPRDAEVAIPDFAETNFTGFRTKINAAFAYGARTPAGKPDDSATGRTNGAALTMLTINNLVPGGLKFNGAAIINFKGFKEILNAIGGVHMCVDEDTRSIHYDINNKYHSTTIQPVSFRKLYKKGCQDLTGWEALDFARQRHFDNGDYTRQRHQQQLLMAIFKKLTSKGTLTDLGKLSELQKAAGQLLTLDLGRTAVEDWVFTLKGLKAENVVMIKTNGGKTNPIGNGNERLNEDTMKLLQAVHDDTVFDFLTKHATWVATEKG
jgi:LCP family protein required for cell wall assembly